jgi:O-methyltransferase involved in polyketide biosynthesis
MFRVPLPAGSTIFDLDLPSMLRRRVEALAAIPQNGYPTRIEVPIDLHLHDVAEKVIETGHFDSTLPCLVVWEGGSMYFDKQSFQRIVASIPRLLQHRDSRLWLDYVDVSVIDGSSGFPVVDEFMNAMRCLGEPFITGFKEIEVELRHHGLVIQEDTPSRRMLKSDDPVFDLYKFCVLRRG